MVCVVNVTEIRIDKAVSLFPGDGKKMNFYGIEFSWNLILAGRPKRVRNSAWENLITK